MLNDLTPADPRETDAAQRLRYYIFGLLRKYPDQSVRIPSSYQLAKEFETSRGAIRYELERLAESGVLLCRHRVGTFTNPQSNYARSVLLDAPMAMVGVLYGSGEYFSYAEFAAKTLAALLLRLSDESCYVHLVKLQSRQPMESKLRDITALGLDGLIWAGHHHVYGADTELIEKLREMSLPLVTIGTLRPGVGGVAPEYARAAEHVAELCRREDRRRVMVISTLDRDREFLTAFIEAVGDGILLKGVDGNNAGDVFEQARMFFAGGGRVDCVLCDGTLAKAVSTLLGGHGIDVERECRVVALGDFLGQSAFTGLVMRNPFEEYAAHAVRILKSRIAGDAGLPEHKRIPMRPVACHLPGDILENARNPAGPPVAVPGERSAVRS